MTVHSFIADKRDGRRHSSTDLAWFVRAITAGEIPDYQISAWLMAAYINGLDPEETSALAIAMANSGERLQLQGLPKPTIDKHSTGGVGDAVTLLFLPIMAASGVPVVKMSGKGLGFTGGTIDKLESVPGFRTNLSPEELRKQALEVGCALGGQTAELAPADKVLYALRDATETIGSIPLISASVMSKKLAAGADCIVLDVKCGSGAFMKTPQQAKTLAQALSDIGCRAGKKVKALITNMDEPLAPAVGNALEVAAAIEELKAGCKGKLGRVTLALCNAALQMTEKAVRAEDAVASGKALEKMREWFAAQGGDASVIDDTSRLPQAPVTQNVLASNSGYATSMDCALIGESARALGAGRIKKEDKIDYSVGLKVHKRIGDKVAQGDPLFTVHAKSPEDVQEAVTKLEKTSINLSATPVPAPALIEEFS